ncbi:hypothetical protein EDC01DRAFT_630628 [Geopyxis carbonaria]|nr:hypothetical protein EDC01DRAFT_630628 [Geopyxis carbonaria]
MPNLEKLGTTNNPITVESDEELSNTMPIRPQPLFRITGIHNFRARNRIPPALKYLLTGRTSPSSSEDEGDDASPSPPEPTLLEWYRKNVPPAYPMRDDIETPNSEKECATAADDGKIITQAAENHDTRVSEEIPDAKPFSTRLEQRSPSVVAYSEKDEISSDSGADLSNDTLSDQESQCVVRHPNLPWPVADAPKQGRHDAKEEGYFSDVPAISSGNATIKNKEKDAAISADHEDNSGTVQTASDDLSKCKKWKAIEALLSDDDEIEYFLQKMDHRAVMKKLRRSREYKRAKKDEMSSELGADLPNDTLSDEKSPCVVSPPEQPLLVVDAPKQGRQDSKEEGYFSAVPAISGGNATIENGEKDAAMSADRDDNPSTVHTVNDNRSKCKKRKAEEHSFSDNDDIEYIQEKMDHRAVMEKRRGNRSMKRARTTLNH